MARLDLVQGTLDKKLRYGRITLASGKDLDPYAKSGASLANAIFIKHLGRYDDETSKRPCWPADMIMFVRADV